MAVSVKTGIILAGAVAAGVIAYMIARRVPDAARAVGQAVNPLNENNLANRAFNAVTEAVTGSSETLGSRLYTLLHPNYDKNYYVTPYPDFVDPYTGDYKWTALDQEDADMGLAMRQIAMAETPGGAVTGIVRGRR